MGEYISISHSFLLLTHIACINFKTESQQLHRNTLRSIQCMRVAFRTKNEKLQRIEAGRALAALLDPFTMFLLISRISISKPCEPCVYLLAYHTIGDLQLANQNWDKDESYVYEYDTISKQYLLPFFSCPDKIWNSAVFVPKSGPSHQNWDGQDILNIINFGLIAHLTKKQ